MPDIRHHDQSSLCTERTLIWPLFTKVSKFGPFTRRADFYQSLEAIPKSHETPYQAQETCTFLLFEYASHLLDLMSLGDMVFPESPSTSPRLAHAAACI